MQHVFSNSSVSPQNSRCQIWEFVFKNIIILSRNFVLFKNVAGFTRNNVAVLISSRIVHAIHPFYLTRCFFYTNTFYLIHIIICHKQFVLKENHISLSFLYPEIIPVHSYCFCGKLVQQNEHIIDLSFSVQYYAAFREKV